jgi:hypothetical protein
MADLTGTIWRVGDLNAETRAAMFGLYDAFYEGTSEGLFFVDLADKTYAIILRNQEGVLKGFSSIKVWDETFEGRPVRILYSGDTIVHKDHWGQQALVAAWGRLTGAVKASAPEVPLYWFLLVKGHRTYRYLRTFYRIFFPAHNRETPPDYQALMNLLAGKKFGEFYIPETGIVHFPESRGHLKADFAEIPDKDKNRPDVRYFLERNPGYVHGDELVCLTELSHKNFNSLATQIFAAGYDAGLEQTLAAGGA